MGRNVYAIYIKLKKCFDTLEFPFFSVSKITEACFDFEGRLLIERERGKAWGVNGCRIAL